jgi:hypothetical protein
MREGESLKAFCVYNYSRVWNICFRHGLIKSGGPRELDYQVIRDNITDVTSFCTRIRTSDLNAGPDCPAKLFDMAMTAVEILKRSKTAEADPSQSTGRGRNWSVSQHGLITIVYNTLGLLAAVSRR